MQKGGAIGFYSGDSRKIISDCQSLRPTIFGAVPRVWNRLYDKLVQARDGPGLKGALVKFALRKKVLLVENGVHTKNTIWDKLVFSKIQAMLGGRVDFAVTGAAPMKSEVLNILRAARGCS